MTPHITSGVLVFRPSKDGWTDSIGIVDDDGMALVISELKRWHGTPVKITIEVDTEHQMDPGHAKRWEESRRALMRGEDPNA